MTIILSGKYIDGELQFLFGRIPPVLLPLKNKELLHYQLELLKGHTDLFITLPNEYNPSKDIKALLTRYNVNVIKTGAHLSLLQVLLFVADNYIKRQDESMQILFGDTYFSAVPAIEDGVAVVSKYVNYKWEYVNAYNNDNLLAIAGFFVFKHVKLLKSLLNNLKTFEDLVNKYCKGTNCTLLNCDDIWYDLGHYNTYFQTKKNYTTERSFNNLTIQKETVIKTGTNISKIASETFWFKNIPPALKINTPVFINDGIFDNGEAWYEMEHVYLPTLSELLVFGNQSSLFWKYVVESISIFVDKMLCQHNTDEDTLIEFYISKNKARFEELEKLELFDLDIEWTVNGVKLPTVRNIYTELSVLISNNKVNKGIVHGDLCFSNIFYDNKSNLVKVIDPRGGNWEQNGLSIYGDLNYDIAKLLHSILGCYDFIMAGKYRLDITGDNIDFEVYTNENQCILEKLIFEEGRISQIAVKENIPLMISLFISMIPLHSDDKERQKALLANALYLYAKYLKR